MPGAGSATYIVAAVATANVASTPGVTPNGGFNPGNLPQPVIDNVSIANGQYFLLTAQTNVNQNGIWYADANGPVPVMTLGAGGSALDPNTVVSVGPGFIGQSQNAGTTWTYTAVSHNGGPGFALI
jgi:hypothetical protein